MHTVWGGGDSGHELIQSKARRKALQLTDFFVVACFGQQELILAEILTAEELSKKNIEAIWASSFKIRAKIEIQEHFLVHLTSQTSLCMSRDMVLQIVCSVWLFTVKTSSFIYLFIF